MLFRTLEQKIIQDKVWMYNVPFLCNLLLNSRQVCVSFRHLNSRKQLDFQECCKILNVSDNPDEKEIKDAFVLLVKKYHPDSYSTEADNEKFAEIESAYRILKESLTGRKDESTSEIKDKDFGIKHTVPQHRHFLSYDGKGHGTLSQRKRQYESDKINRASENIFDYKKQQFISKQENQVILKDASLARQYKTRQAMERLVEDLILESIEKGEFDNLPGSGKPLKHSTDNPYVDSMTYKLNQILINNGFAPEWLTLQREINSEKEKLKIKLRERRSFLGPVPLSNSDEEKWNSIIQSLTPEVKKLNFKVDKYNMIVPAINNQQMHFQLKKEANKVLQDGNHKLQFSNEENKASSKSSESENQGLFGILSRIFH